MGWRRYGAMVAAASLLAGCTSPSETSPGAPAPTETSVPTSPAAEPTVEPSGGLPPNDFPMAEVDVDDLERVVPVPATTPGPAPRVPWIRAVGASEDRGLLTWGSRRLVLEADSPFHVSEAGVFAGGSGEVVRYEWDGSRTWVHREQRWNGAWSAVPVGDRLWFTVRGRPGHGLAWWDVGDQGIHEVELAAEAGEPGWIPRVSLQGALGADDAIYQASWELPASQIMDLGFRRTSGRPASWDLREVVAVSRAAQLVAGQPRQTGQRPGCLAVYRAAASEPEWTKCFVRSGRPRALTALGFTHGGARLVVMVEGGRWVNPASMFHVGHHTVLVLDATDGRVRAGFDGNFNQAVLEDDEHFLYVRHRRPIESNGTDEGPYTSWIMRCSLAGECEPATGAIPNDTFSRWGVAVLKQTG